MNGFRAACVAVVVGVLGRAASAADVQAGFDDGGLSSVRVGGVEVLHAAPMGLPMLDLRHAFPPAPVAASTTQPTAAFDPAAHRLTQTYPWGTLACTYRAEGDRLLLDVEVRNTTVKDSIFGIAASPLQLHLPGKVTTHGWDQGWPTPSVLTDAPQILDVAWPGGAIAVCNEQVERPLWLGLERVGQSDDYTVVMRHDGPPRGQEIGAGDARQFSLSVRFGPVGATSVQLAPDVYQRFAAAYPPELAWADRRPIGCCFLSSIESRSKTNPTGWLHDSTVDTTTPAGLADWRTRLLARADKAASVGKEMGCQGVIVWDIEGPAQSARDQLHR